MDIEIIETERLEKGIMYKETPLLSVVMATYNGERFLKEQLDSIFTQTLQPSEVIVCDDGSSDNTMAILYAYKEKYEVLSLYQNSEPVGVVKNFQKAISLAKGRYIALSDQDDIWHQDKLEKLVEAMQKEEKRDAEIPLMVHSDLRMIDERGEEIHPSYFSFRNYTLPKERSIGYILGPCSILGNTLLINQTLASLVVPFPEGLVVHDYWIALLNELYGKRITLERTLVSYRIHQNNTSNHQKRLEKSIKHSSSFIHLPYRDIGRERVLKTLLKQERLSTSDRKVIHYFLDYLELRGNRIKLFYRLCSESLIKKGFFYRIHLFYKLLRK